jgi:hypothetical protein
VRTLLVKSELRHICRIVGRAHAAMRGGPAAILFHAGGRWPDADGRCEEGLLMGFPAMVLAYCEEYELGPLGRSHGSSVNAGGAR